MAWRDYLSDSPLTIKYFLTFLLLLGFSSVQAQLLINEACSDNETIIADEYGDFSDWIEIFNASPETVNLQGYFLSDDPAVPSKWAFPEISIPPDGFLLVFASDRDIFNDHIHTSFKLSKTGETILLSFPDGTEADRIALPALESDFSYGRQEDADDSWNYFNEPSPGSSNNFSQPLLQASQPVFSVSQSFHDQAIHLEITASEANVNIFYTLDGSEPDENAILYSGAFIIDTTTVIRAIVSGNGWVNSVERVRTYFIGEDHTLPIVALTTDPPNLYDPIDGIFMLGPEADSIFPFLGANFWKEIEIPGHFEYLVDKQLVLEYSLGLEIHGGRGARTQPMKPLRLLAKSEFGTEKFEYPFFYNKNIESFERLVLRNASGDYNVGHMRDPFLARYCIDEQLDLDVLAYQPVVVYINGAYYGVMELREKSDARFLRDNYGIDPDNIDLLEEDSLIIEGDFTNLDMHQAFVEENDLSDEFNFQIAASYFDVNNIADYFSVQTIVNNTDWPNNNIKYWRERTDDAKWRYLLFDMDPALGRYVWSVSTVNSFGNKMQKDYIRHIRIFKSLLENTNYRHYFINRYADLLNTTFKTESLTAEILRSRDILDPEMEQHLSRWSADYNNWYDVEIPKMISFTEERPDLAREYLREYFELEGIVSLSLKTYPESAGSIQINSVTPEQLPWSGYYFKGVPVSLTVSPNPGFEFSHWEFSNFSDQIQSTTIKDDFKQDETIIAVFKNAYSGTNLKLSPNPATSYAELSFDLEIRENVEILIYDYTGKLLRKLSLGKLPVGKNKTNLQLSDLQTGVYLLKLKTPSKVASAKFVKL